MSSSNTRKMVLAALFTALTTVATMVIRVPSLGPSGYANIGDTMVLLSAWILGGWYGFMAAGLGSALADLFAGYVIYAPGTFVIKFLMAFAAFYLFRTLSGKGKVNFHLSCIVSAAAAEIIMVLGYFGYEAVFLGYGLGAAPAIISNVFQGLTNIVLGTVILFALKKANVLSKIYNEQEMEG